MNRKHIDDTTKATLDRPRNRRDSGLGRWPEAGISSSLQIRQDLRWPESTPDDQTVRLFQVLGNRIRLRILWLLAHREEFGVEIDPCCDGEVVRVCSIKALFDISAPDLSHHLKVLREAGLVEAQRVGIWTHYSPRSDSLATALEVLSELHGNDRHEGRPGRPGGPDGRPLMQIRTRRLAPAGMPAPRCARTVSSWPGFSHLRTESALVRLHEVMALVPTTSSDGDLVSAYLR